MKLAEIVQIQRTCGHICGDDSDKNKRTAKEGIERQLHRAVLLVGRSPNRDQKILRHDYQFIEDKKKEQIGPKKNAARLIINVAAAVIKAIQRAKRRGRKSNNAAPAKVM